MGGISGSVEMGEELAVSCSQSTDSDLCCCVMSSRWRQSLSASGMKLVHK